MNVTPQGTVHLLSTPLENDYKNQLKFSSSTSQYNYFYGRRIKTATEITYMREQEAISVPFNRDELTTVNYIMYKNNGFTDKWFYAFVTKIEYMNENASKVYFEIDSYQSWQFDITIRQSFVVREHVSDDIIGNHTLEEGLELGEYIHAQNSNIAITPESYEWWMCALVTKRAGVTTYENGEIYEGVYSGLRMYATKSKSNMNKFLGEYDTAGEQDAVVKLFYVPDFLLSASNVNSFGWVNPSTKGKSTRKTISFSQNNIDGYTPRNKKLFCYPYNVIALSNYEGNSAILRPELFSTFGNYVFEYISTVVNNVSLTCYPRNYKKANDISSSRMDIDEGISLNNFPSCSWDSDYYKNWVALNQASQNQNLALGLASSGLGTAVGVASGNAVGIAGSLLSASGSVASHLQRQNQAEMITPQSKGNNNSDVLSAQNKKGVFFIHKTIKSEYARIIDDYFHMYGYKRNRMKVPNISTRSNFNYVETRDIKITASIPQDDLNKIRNMFNSGVTLWHNTSNFKNYNVSN